jgi:hypothetical protein
MSHQCPVTIYLLSVHHSHGRCCSFCWSLSFFFLNCDWFVGYSFSVKTQSMEKWYHQNLNYERKFKIAHLLIAIHVLWSNTEMYFKILESKVIFLSLSVIWKIYVFINHILCHLYSIPQILFEIRHRK